MMFNTRSGDLGRWLAGMLAVGAMLWISLPASTAQDDGGGVDTTKKTAKDWLEDFFYYMDIGRWDLCAASGQKFLEEKPDPVEVYRLVQSPEFGVDGLRKLTKGATVNEPKPAPTMTVAEVCQGIMKLWREGYDKQKLDLKLIQEAIDGLNKGERSYQLNLAQLRQTGLFAVPVMITYMTDRTKADYRPVIERALGEMEKPSVVPPIAAALKVGDDAVKLMLMRVLAKLGFSAALPALQQQATDAKNSEMVRQAAANAVARISRSPAVANTSAAELYLQLAEKYLKDDPTLRPDASVDPTSIYAWDASGHILAGRKCSLSIFMAVMAQRCCEEALRLERSEKAVSLWLTAVGLKDSIKERVLTDDPSATVSDPGLGAGQGDATYYYFSSGQKYMFDVLNRAINDGQMAVALRALVGLQNVATPSGLQQPGSQALSRALRFPDRRIRTNAAFVGATICPDKVFPGSEQVAPALGDALARPAGRLAVLVLTEDSAVNKLKTSLEAENLTVKGATSMDRAMLMLVNTPSVDVFIVGEKVGSPDVSEAYRKIRQHARFGQATIVILASLATMDRYDAMRTDDKNLAVVADTTDAAGIVRAYRKTEAAAGRTPLGAAEAKQLALKAAAYLKRIAQSADKQVFDAADAIDALLAAFADRSDVDIRKAAGEVLALLSASRAQQALANVALDTAEDKAMRITALDMLGESARRNGVLADEKSVAALVALATDEADLALRTAAGKAVGAMDLSSVQIADLILKFAQ